MSTFTAASLVAPARAPVSALRARKVGGRRTVAAPARAAVVAEGEAIRFFYVMTRILPLISHDAKIYQTWRRHEPEL